MFDYNPCLFNIFIFLRIAQMIKTINYKICINYYKTFFNIHFNQFLIYSLLYNLYFVFIVCFQFITYFSFILFLTIFHTLFSILKLFIIFSINKFYKIFLSHNYNFNCKKFKTLMYKTFILFFLIPSFNQFAAYPILNKSFITQNISNLSQNFQPNFYLRNKKSILNQVQNVLIRENSNPDYASLFQDPKCSDFVYSNIFEPTKDASSSLSSSSSSNLLSSSYFSILSTSKKTFPAMFPSRYALTPGLEESFEFSSSKKNIQEYVFHTPNYPKHYPLNIECNKVIAGRLQINF